MTYVSAVTRRYELMNGAEPIAGTKYPEIVCQTASERLYETDGPNIVTYPVPIRCGHRDMILVSLQVAKPHHRGGVIDCEKSDVYLIIEAMDKPLSMMAFKVHKAHVDINNPASWYIIADDGYAYRETLPPESAVDYDFEKLSQLMYPGISVDVFRENFHDRVFLNHHYGIGPR